MKNILIIGSGAREHALAKALNRSSHHPHIFCYATSRNPGISKLSRDYKIGDICQIEKIVEQAKQWKIDLVIIGPEAPLEKGLADLLWENHIPVIGPKKILAQLETSKAFTRNLLNKFQIPGSPIYRVFGNLNGVKDFLHQLGENNYVIKANGLMGGKGVKVAGDHLQSIHEAYQFCEELHAKSHDFVIEENLIGQEFSLLSFCDGNTLVSMPAVQDHKRLRENDEGANTGGMGSYSDANHRLPFLTEQDIQDAHLINCAVIEALKKECDEKYIGILYGSFIATQKGVQVIEYNARFGDPEAMNVLAILESDFVDICQAMVSEKLSVDLVRFSSQATVCKYLVPQGYPENPEKNFKIDVSAVQNPDQLYYASVEDEGGKLNSLGSRAIAVLGIADSIAKAEKIAEAEIQRIQGNLIHRRDIGTQELIQRRIQHMREIRKCFA